MSIHHLTKGALTPNEIPSIVATSEGMGECYSVAESMQHHNSNELVDKVLSDNSAKSQRERLLSYLEQHGSITTTHAREFLNIYDPRVRKHELVRQGYPIVMTWVVAVTAQGFSHKVGLYTLVKESMQGELL